MALLAEEILIKNGVSLSKLADNNVLRKSFSLGERILGGRCILKISNVVSPEEIDILLGLSHEAAAERRKQCGVRSNGGFRNHDDSGRGGAYDKTESSMVLEEGNPGKVFVRLLTRATARRENAIDDAMPKVASELVDVILERVLTFLDSNNICPSLKMKLFFDGADTTKSTIAGLFRDDKLDYSIREPAINVYEAPHGQFVMHKDHHALSIVIPLSDPKKDFHGGGTAFWNQSHPIDGMDRPSIVLKPKPGTALLWGGRVSHKGMLISEGTRVVIVASFSGPDSPNMRDDVRDRLSAGLGIRSIMSAR